MRQHMGGPTKKAAKRAAAPRPESSPASETEAMDDQDVVGSIREQFDEEVGEGLARVHVAVSGGLVTLTGEVASEELREVARLIVEDENGLQVNDRILIDPTAGECPGESERPEPHLPEDAGMDATEIDAEDVSENILEVEDEGIGFDAPSRPVPER